MILNGIYTVEGKPDVHLIELSIDHPPEAVDMAKITQEVEGVTNGSWQSPWDEKYLDERGEAVIGDWIELPTGQTQTRLLFFFHFLNFDKPLLTPFGELRLTSPSTMPARLKDLIVYEEPD